MKKILFYFIPLNFDICLKKGNITYLRCYEVFFKRSYIIYFNSEIKSVKKIGKTIYIGVGGSRYIYVNILKAPFFLLNLYNRVKPNVCITTDWLYSFWSAILIRFKRSYLFFPVCFVGDILKSPFPNDMRYKFIENLSIKLSLLFAPKVCVVPSQLKHDPFWEGNPLTRNKLIKLPQTVEEFPTLEFLQEISVPHTKPLIFQEKKSIKLVTISRLYKDKKLDEALETIQIIIDRGINIDLYIFGDGMELESLTKLAYKLGLQDNVHFMGALSNEALVPFLQSADIYLSILTGTAMREAILCDLPVVTYKNIMTQMYFEEYGSIGYITSENSPQALAEGVFWYLQNEDKHREVRDNLSKLKQRWSLKNLEKSLHETFDPYMQA